MDHIFLGFFFSLQISQTFFLFPFSWEMGLICNRTLIFHLYYGFFLLPLLVIIITPHIVGRLPFFLWLSYFFHRNFIALVRDRIGQDRVKGGGESSDVVLGRNEERSLAKIFTQFGSNQFGGSKMNRFTRNPHCIFLWGVKLLR